MPDPNGSSSICVRPVSTGHICCLFERSTGGDPETKPRFGKTRKEAPGRSDSHLRKGRTRLEPVFIRFSFFSLIHHTTHHVVSTRPTQRVYHCRLRHGRCRHHQTLEASRCHDESLLDLQGSFLNLWLSVVSTIWEKFSPSLFFFCNNFF